MTPSFGELYVGGSRPERWRHVFASVQSLTAYGVENIPADAYDIVVIDEFHHAQAATYRRLIDHLTPRELVGLTATPERADGIDVRAFFDGRTAAELRLWEALSADLLCPFHYFGVADGTDLRSVTWRTGRYDDTSLSNVYTGNDARAAIVLSQLRDKVMDLGRMRALGFCVSVAHAEYMAAVFTEAGIPSHAVSGRLPRPIASVPSTTFGRGESTSCSRPTCSTRASTCQTSTPSSSCGPPRARRSSFSSSVVVCAARVTRQCSPHSTSLAIIARSFGSTSAIAL